MRGVDDRRLGIEARTRQREFLAGAARPRPSPSKSLHCRCPPSSGKADDREGRKLAAARVGASRWRCTLPKSPAAAAKTEWPNRSPIRRRIAAITNLGMDSTKPAKRADCVSASRAAIRVGRDVVGGSRVSAGRPRPPCFTGARRSLEHRVRIGRDRGNDRREKLTDRRRDGRHETSRSEWDGHRVRIGPHQTISSPATACDHAHSLPALHSASSVRSPTRGCNCGMDGCSPPVGAKMAPCGGGLGTSGASATYVIKNCLSCYLYLKNVIKIALCTLLGHGQPSPALRRAPQSPWPHAHPPTARHSLRWFASAWVSFRAHGWKIQGPGTSSRVSRKGPAAGHRQALRQLPRDARAGLGRELLVM